MLLQFQVDDATKDAQNQAKGIVGTASSYLDDVKRKVSNQADNAGLKAEGAVEDAKRSAKATVGKASSFLDDLAKEE